MERVTASYRNFSVTVWADSVVDFGEYGRHRNITIEAKYWRGIHAEIMTHREKSINGASSRAIPIEKMIAMVLENPFVPDVFPRKGKGMQPLNWFDPEGVEHKMLTHVWFALRDFSIASARLLDKLDITKQLANRVLEPFLMYRTLMSGTEWENMLALRAHSDAQHEFQILANLMLEAFNKSTPTLLTGGEWHVPFGDLFDEERINKLFSEIVLEGKLPISTKDELRRIIATARCARISYNTFEGADDYVKDLELYLSLVESGHWSPFEHVSQAMTLEEYLQYSHTGPGWVEYGWLGNMRGFKQLRKTYPRNKERREDSRLLKK